MSRKNWEDDSFVEAVKIHDKDGNLVVDGIKPVTLIKEGDVLPGYEGKVIDVCNGELFDKLP